MITNFLWLMNYVRENILEKFILPELEISYWEFLIYLAIVGVVATVLINSVQISGNSSFNAKRESEYRDVLRGRERVKADERAKIKRGNKLDSDKSWSIDERILNKWNSDD